MILTTGWSDGTDEMETTCGETVPKSITGSESLALAFGRSEVLFGVTGAAFGGTESNFQANRW